MKRVYKIANKKSNIFAMNKASEKGMDGLDKQAGQKEGRKLSARRGQL
jgi:hypothetical protein